MSKKRKEASLMTSDVGSSKYEQKQKPYAQLLVDSDNALTQKMIDEMKDDLPQLKQCQMELQERLKTFPGLNFDDISSDNINNDNNKFTKKMIDGVKNDLPKLKQLKIDIEEYVKTLPFKESFQPTFLLGAVERHIHVLTESETRARNQQLSKSTQSRIAEIDFQVAETPMKFMHDYYNFENRVESLFNWYYKGERNTYLSPYFPFVQSSGMGKTKLMYEFRQRHNKRKVFLVSCFRSVENPPSDRGIYDHVLLVKLAVLDYKEERKRIISILDEIVKDVGFGMEAVLLIDEAQVLLNCMDGFTFLVLRRWLRSTNGKIVGVLAGTLLEMCNFPEKHTEPNYSRDPRQVIGKKLYDPFYMLCTIGLEKNSKLVQRETDLDCSVKFGRPLFARLAANGDLDDGVLKAIRHRILLGESSTYPNSPSTACCLSVLGTRVQMGQTTFGNSSKMVARGYANVVQLKFTEDADVAYLSFLPDPVCAFVAMSLMFQRTAKVLEGRQPQVWTKRAIDMYLSGVCRPDNGNVGLIAAALYLLFCGDVLRAAVDKSFKTFPVPLSDLLQLAAEPNKSYESAASTSDSPRTSVSFIQICRNYLLLTINDLTKSTYLAEWFQGGCAFYSHPSCTVYDIIAPIRVASDQGIKYYPMLISVNNGSLPCEQRACTMSAMTNSIQSTEEGIGVCVLLLMGLKASDTNTVCVDTMQTIKSSLQNWNADGILCFTVAVPEDDCFGCWDLATKTCTGLGEEAEIYTSHLQVHQSSGTPGIEPDRLLRHKASESMTRNFRNMVAGYDRLASPCKEDETVIARVDNVNGTK